MQVSKVPNFEKIKPKLYKTGAYKETSALHIFRLLKPDGSRRCHGSESGENRENTTQASDRCVCLQSYESWETQPHYFALQGRASKLILWSLRWCSCIPPRIRISGVNVWSCPPVANVQHLSFWLEVRSNSAPIWQPKLRAAFLNDVCTYWKYQLILPPLSFKKRTAS